MMKIWTTGSSSHTNQQLGNYAHFVHLGLSIAINFSFDSSLIDYVLCLYLCLFSWHGSGEVMVLRPVSAIGNLRPISMYARMAASNGDPRYMVGATT